MLQSSRSSCCRTSSNPVYVNGRSRSISTWLFFFFNDTATTEIYTLSLHDALPIFATASTIDAARAGSSSSVAPAPVFVRSEEHTSELQSQSNLVCRLLLEKKKKID